MTSPPGFPESVWSTAFANSSDTTTAASSQNGDPSSSDATNRRAALACRGVPGKARAHDGMARTWAPGLAARGWPGGPNAVSVMRALPDSGHLVGLVGLPP